MLTVRISRRGAHEGKEPTCGAMLSADAMRWLASHPSLLASLSSPAALPARSSWKWGARWGALQAGRGGPWRGCGQGGNDSRGRRDGTAVRRQATRGVGSHGKQT